MTRFRTLAVPIALVISALPAVAEGADDAAPSAFEVASIKPTGPFTGSVKMRFLPGGAFEANGITAAMLIQDAFDVRNFEISGLAWINRETYAIQAKPPAPQHAISLLDHLTLTAKADEEERMKMRLQSLLVDRFALKYHREQKEQRRYSLVVAKSGAKMQQFDPARDTGPAALHFGRSSLVGSGVELSLLVQELSRRLGYRVIDNTELHGRYNFTLHWTDDIEPANPSDRDQSAGEGPSIFTAIQEQLGLKLVPQKGLESVLVIDRIERPSAN